jgi:outer membrane protein assembly factor BamB
MSRIRPFLTFALLGCLAAVALPAASTPSWPQFRGPNAAGVAEDAKPPVQFGPDTNLRWKTPLPAGLSSPVVWGHRIFLTALGERSASHARL